MKRKKKKKKKKGKYPCLPVFPLIIIQMTKLFWLLAYKLLFIFIATSWFIPNKQRIPKRF